MSRPVKCRHVQCHPDAVYFKPRAVPLCDLEELVLTYDELEALRLCDGLRLEQGSAAKMMKVHRATVSRILIAARKKVANALVHHHGIKIEGGCCMMKPEKTQKGDKSNGRK